MLVARSSAPVSGTTAQAPPALAPAVDAGRVELTGSPVTTSARQEAAGPGAAAQTAGYYATVQGRTGAQLLEGLHGIVRSGHQALGYDKARDALFGRVADLSNTDVVRDMYTGDARSGVHDRRTAIGNDLNAEHLWPQSEGAKGTAKSDLHHLMPADADANSRRSSHPYGEVVREHWATGDDATGESRIGSAADGTTVFEPRAQVRGDVARALMYFHVRYDGDRPPDYSDANFRRELPTLLEWHRQDPVDDVERQRHEQVFQLQGNRNPFIDNPEWADSFRALRDLS